jgi:hypothetical protein
MIPPDLPAWLYADVPLYAFLAALLTRPYTWSNRLSNYFTDDKDN